MPKLSKFISLARSMIDRGIYVWDLNGIELRSLTEQIIRDKEQSEKWAKKAIAMWKKRKDKYPDAIAADCSGFVVWCLVNCGAKKAGFDVTAEGFRKNQCFEIDKGDLRDGDLCFKMGTRDGIYKAVHVGIYYDGKVIEDRGRDYGVVSRSRILGGWNKYGRLKINWDHEGYVLTRLLKKGCKGDDVRELQKLLILLGYNLPKFGADGQLGPEAVAAIKAMQKNSGIKADGIVGRDTCKVLGWTWQG